MHHFKAPRTVELFGGCAAMPRCAAGDTLRGMVSAYMCICIRAPMQFIMHRPFMATIARLAGSLRNCMAYALPPCVLRLVVGMDLEYFTGASWTCTGSSEDRYLPRQLQGMDRPAACIDCFLAARCGHGTAAAGPSTGQ